MSIAAMFNHLIQICKTLPLFKTLRQVSPEADISPPGGLAVSNAPLSALVAHGNPNAEPSVPQSSPPNLGLAAASAAAAPAIFKSNPHYVQDGYEPGSPLEDLHINPHPEGVPSKQKPASLKKQSLEGQPPILGNVGVIPEKVGSGVEGMPASGPSGAYPAHDAGVSAPVVQQPASAAAARPVKAKSIDEVVETVFDAATRNELKRVKAPEARYDEKSIGFLYIQSHVFLSDFLGPKYEEHERRLLKEQLVRYGNVAQSGEGRFKIAHAYVYLMNADNSFHFRTPTVRYRTALIVRTMAQSEDARFRETAAMTYALILLKATDPISIRHIQEWVTEMHTSQDINLQKTAHLVDSFKQHFQDLGI